MGGSGRQQSSACLTTAPPCLAAPTFSWAVTRLLPGGFPQSGAENGMAGSWGQCHQLGTVSPLSGCFLVMLERHRKRKWGSQVCWQMSLSFMAQQQETSLPCIPEGTAMSWALMSV